MVLAAAHGHGHVHAPRAKGQHPNAAPGGGVAVGADEGFPRGTEALQMDLVADAVARTGEIDPVLLGHGLDVAVVVGVFKAALQGIVVNIGHTALCSNPGHAHGLELQIGHGAGGVLSEGLVNAEANVRAYGHFAADQVALNDFLRDGFSHNTRSFYIDWIGSLRMPAVMR